jgi:hypothetical protein
MKSQLIADRYIPKDSTFHKHRCENQKSFRKQSCRNWAEYFPLWGEVEPSTVTEATTGLLYEPRMMIKDDECGAIGGMLGRENLTNCHFVHNKSHVT